MVLTGEAQADPHSDPSLTTAQPQAHAHRNVSFRLVQDPESDSGPVHHWGVVAQTELAPNMSIGIGLLKSKPRKLGSGDWRLESGAPHSRKAAVDVLLKF
jgi:hypothetical protein